MRSPDARVNRLVALWALLFTLATPFLLTTASSRADRLAAQTIRGYIGRDLRDAAEQDVRPLRSALHELDRARVADLVSERKRLGRELRSLADFDAVFGMTPRGVWGYDLAADSTGALVLDRESFPMLHPGASRVGLTLFDRCGMVRARARFTTGWRSYVKGAWLTPVDGFDQPVLVVHTSSFHGPAFDRQYCALIGTEFHLVRVERSGEGAGRNRDYIRHFRSGPEPPWQSAEQWEADLTGGDRPRVLRALVWLGGRHVIRAPGEALGDDQWESAAQGELVRSVRARPGVAARLRELADGGGAWEREMSRLALSPQDVPWRP